MSSASKLAQVGQNVLEDTNTGHVVSYHHVGNQQHPRDKSNSDKSNSDKSNNINNEYDDILNNIMPTALDIDYSKYGL